MKFRKTLALAVGLLFLGIAGCSDDGGQIPVEGDTGGGPSVGIDLCADITQACLNDGDCKSGFCQLTSLTCQTPTYEDSAQNQDETDHDCGGQVCQARCANAKSCLAHSDCQSAFCNPDSFTCEAPTCSDGHQNQDETDQDCGGQVCQARCVNTKKCLAHTDCQMGFCTPDTQLCQTATCEDNYKNQDETDQDCGGQVCQARCANGQTCLVDCDCTSTFCHPGTLQCMTSGLVDEGHDNVGCLFFYRDADNDGFGGRDRRCLCQPTGPWQRTTGGDCDDYSAVISPATGLCQREICVNSATGLQAALAAALPGDLIWLAEGEYGCPVSAPQTCFQALASDVVIRAIPGARARITSPDRDTNGFTISGDRVWLWDVELTNSDLDRNAAPLSASGVRAMGNSDALINLRLHDNGIGIFAGVEAVGTTIYGNIAYGNGYCVPGLANRRMFGHGIYVRNLDGWKHIRQNVSFDNFFGGIQAWGSASNLILQENVAFNNGIELGVACDEQRWIGERTPNLIIGRDRSDNNNHPIQRLSLAANHFYHKAEANRPSVELGRNMTGDGDVWLRANQFMGPQALKLGKWKRVEASDNQIVDTGPPRTYGAFVTWFAGPGAWLDKRTPWDGVVRESVFDGEASLALWSQNAYHTPSAPPFLLWFSGGLGDYLYSDFSGWQTMTGEDGGFSVGRPPDSATVLGNAYDMRRVLIIARNWSNSPVMSVDVSSALAPGARYRLANVENLDEQVAPAPGTAWAIYDGGLIAIPMTPGPVFTPVYPTTLVLDSTAPEFAVFLLYSPNPDGYKGPQIGPCEE